MTGEPMDNENRLDIFNQLRWSLQALAASAEVQRSLFPDYVCKTDELVSDYGHWSRVAGSNYGREFSNGQREAPLAIDRLLNSISFGGSAFEEELWSEAALESHPVWREIRSLAKLALSLFEWSLDVPPWGRSLYAPG